MNVIEAIHYRHSYRGKYKDIPVPKEDLIKIMQAGLDAPSGCNKQTTSLIAVDNPDVLKQLHSVIEPPVGETAPAAICVLPIGIAESDPIHPQKKAFEERAWFNSYNQSN